MALLAVALVVSTTAYSQTKLLRFPDIRADRVAFTYGGDLWTASTNGGVATRLTSHPSGGVFGEFLPDGKRIAFTCQNDAEQKGYVCSAFGGGTRQLTFFPARGPLGARAGWG